MSHVLARAGVSTDEVQAAVLALRKVTNPRRLQIGTLVTLQLRRGEDGPPHLSALSLNLRHGHDLTLVARPNGAFARLPGKDLHKSVETKSRKVTTQTVAKRHELSGVVRGSLRTALHKAGVPANVTSEVRDAFAYDPDLPDRPPRGSRFRLVYREASNNAPASLQLIELVVHGRRHRVYRYELRSGLVAFVTPSGKGVRPIHLTMPVEGARMTSGWGWRMHPILKRKQFHKGIDLAAPLGTPVRAATSGVVEFAGWHGNYGRLLRIRCDDRLSIQYGHLHAFAKGLKPGMRVQEGQVVASIGESGLATGPHLYWEVLIDQQKVNPSDANLSIPLQLAGADLAHFRDYTRTTGGNVLADRSVD